MTVRNGAPYVRDAVESLLVQTDREFEIIVVDDGSTDDTPAILASLSDRRLKVRHLPGRGRVAALIEAVTMARGGLIAVLDADDIAMPHRLATQRRYLEEHPDVALVGSSAIEFDGEREWRRKPIVGRRNIRRALAMYNPFYHSSIMFRCEAYEAAGGYRNDGGWGHDKDLLIRIAMLHDVDIIEEPLIRYRRHGDQWTRRDGETFRLHKSTALQMRAARQLGLPLLYWVYPICGWLYARIPSALRPRWLKEPVKRAMLRALRITS
jgi:glycosyltransferase involved in cell wall biosynthesis